MRILNAADIHAAIDMREAIDAVREGFIALSTDRARVPLRSSLSTPDGITLFMPAYLEGAAFSAIKVVSVYGKNPQRGLPTIMATVLVLDAQTGQPKAILDGAYLTALRTGAASGLATDLLARPDAAVVGLVGAGAQARMQIEGVCAVRPIREIRIYSRRAESATNLAAELVRDFPSIMTRAVPSADEALRGADILIASTTSSTPVISAEHVSPGAHINGIGSYTPNMQEVAAEVVTSARIVVDSRESAMAEAGDLLMPIDQGLMTADAIYGEIGEIASGSKPGRLAHEREIVTFFKSVGTAVQDAAAAARIVARAEEKKLGTLVPL